MATAGAKALKIWRERLDDLLADQAQLGPDPSLRFAVKKQIEEAREKIRELESGGRAAEDEDSPAAGAFCHNLPYASLGGLFQGREAMLARLRERLAAAPAGPAPALAVQVVHGLGGVGKTRLAVEYAWRHAAEHGTALFVGAGSPADLRRNLAALCGPAVLDLPEKAAAEEEVREMAVRRWLLDHPGWLLILDNVDSEEAAAAVDGLVAGLAGGHALVTGRIARWGAEVEPLELDVLAEEAAAEFLLARTAGRRRATGEDGALALALARELGSLPLTLEQAGAAIAERRLTFAAYLAEWRERREVVLAWFDPRVSRYPLSVAATWQTSVDRLAAPARRLLDRLAWLGPEPIPETLLEVAVPRPAADRGFFRRLFSGKARALPREDLRDALVQLATYSLVTRAEAPAFTLHRLVQDVTRRSLEREGEVERLAEALRWVDGAFEGDPQDVRNWPALDPLAPHAGAAASFADRAGITEPTARLMSVLALLFSVKALYAEAEPLMRRALWIDEKGFGPEHPNVAADLNNLAHLLQATNHLSEAEPLMRRALSIDEKCFGPEHPRISAQLSNLAALLMATKRLADAEPLVRRALWIDEKSFGLEHPNVALCLNNLAQLLQDTHRVSEAESLLRRALRIFLDFTRRTGHEHPHLQTVLDNFCLLLQEMGKSPVEIEAALEALVRPLK
jgi:tetratricopeptide (TPR) repeat protein